MIKETFILLCRQVPERMQVPVKAQPLNNDENRELPGNGRIDKNKMN